MTAPIQKGTAVLVGIGDYTISGYIVQTVNIENDAEEEVIREGVNNTTKTVILSDPAVQLTVEAVVENGTTASTLKRGDAVTVNDVAYRIANAPSLALSGNAARIRLQLRKEASMSYTA